MTDAADRPGFAFGQDAPPEVSGYLKYKGIFSSWSWEDVEPEEHAVAFAAAKATNARVLTAIKTELERAIDEGIPFEQFQRDLKPRLQKLGWWGVKRRYDPELKKERLVRLGTPRRLKVIYDANLRSARAAGEWSRIQRTKAALPYLLYELGPSEVHREHHVSQEGTILPVDDPYWNQWYPPNGWGCKCRVRQISRREAERRGISKSPEQFPTKSWTNKRTGEVKEIPLGIDPGWERNPGVLRRQHMERFLAQTLEETPPEIAKTMARDMVTSWRFRRVHDGTAPGRVPIAILSEQFAAQLEVGSRVVQFSDWTAEKQKRKHHRITPEHYLRVQKMIEDEQITAIRNNDGEHHRQFSLIEFDPMMLGNKKIEGWAAIIRYYPAEGALFLQSFHEVEKKSKLNSLMKRGKRIR